MIWQVTEATNGQRLICLDPDMHQEFDCLIGKNGMIQAAEKREGDNASPIGVWPLRAVYYRPDRVARPVTALPIIAITPEMGWCDDPADPAYNQLITRPYDARHELMWRDDHLYDLVITLGYNDAPPVAMKGSAIFLHLREPTTLYTAGCVAIHQDDFLALVATATPDSAIQIGSD